jgi:catalase
VVAHLLNVDEALAQAVAQRLGIAELPEAASAAREPLADLPESPALSILRNPPESFAGRNLGVLLSPGFDADLLEALQKAAQKVGAQVTLIGPAVEGVEDARGKSWEVDERLGGGPSVLYDAVALLVADEAVEDLIGDPDARDFASDAFAHYKFVAFTSAAQALFAHIGVEPDDGFAELTAAQDAAAFLDRCRALRYWQRDNAA